MRLCRDCRFITERPGYFGCIHPNNLRPDYVRGLDGKTRNTIEFLRDENDKCGPDAAWFAPKAVQETEA